MTLRRLSACCVSLSCALLGACSEPVAPDVDATLADLTPASAEVTIPFRGQFYTDLAGLAPDPACGAPPWLLNTQVGAGHATHLGQFTVHITFCVDATDLLDDGQLTAGESLPYVDGFGTMVAANGDELHIEIEGAVIPSTNPEYDFQFSDPFTFVGGTGRFTEATGAGMTSSFVSSAIQRTTHDWTGTLTVSRGN